MILLFCCARSFPSSDCGGGCGFCVDCGWDCDDDSISDEVDGGVVDDDVDDDVFLLVDDFEDGDLDGTTSC